MGQAHGGVLRGVCLGTLILFLFILIFVQKTIRIKRTVFFQVD